MPKVDSVGTELSTFDVIFGRRGDIWLTRWTLNGSLMPNVDGVGTEVSFFCMALLGGGIGGGVEETDAKC